MMREKNVIRLGICAMSKKSGSAPMREIVRRLNLIEFIRVIIFDEAMILTQPVETWPICECLISFFSTGFPLDKAIAYEQLRRPYVINDLEAQWDLQDRRKVYQILEQHNIQTPRHTICDRTSQADDVSIEDSFDSVDINGTVINKPFVEKPISAEDHRVHIYFPTTAGLFHRSDK
mgnify:CR=1 FL=1